MKKRRWYVLTAIGFLTLGLVYSSFDDPKKTVTEVSTQGPEMPKQVRRVSLLRGQPDETSRGLLQESSVKNVVAELEKTRDYRAFYMSLLSGRNGKSALYARHVLLLCRSLRDSDLGHEPSSATRQDEARQMIADRCANFTDEELAASGLLAIDKDRRLDKDSSDIHRAWMEAADDPAQRRQMLKKILATDDPLILEYLGPSLYMRDGNGVGFAGKVYSGENDVWIFGSAWLAAACDGAQIYCGSGDRFVVEQCARSGVCASNRTEMLRAMTAERFGKEGSVLFEEIYPAFVSAIKTRNVSPFFN